MEAAIAALPHLGITAKLCLPNNGKETCSVRLPHLTLSHPCDVGDVHEGDDSSLSAASSVAEGATTFRHILPTRGQETLSNQESAQAL